MELWQAFLLGMMVAWTPGLIVLAILLREIETARAHHAWRWSGCSAALPF